MTEHAPVAHRHHWTWICSVSPYVLLLTLVRMAAHIRTSLGHWPSFGEECNTVLFRIHEFVLVGIGWFALFLAAPLWVLLLFFRRHRLGWRLHVVQAVIFALGWLLIFVAGKYDPTPFTYWLLD